MWIEKSNGVKFARVLNSGAAGGGGHQHGLLAAVAFPLFYRSALFTGRLTGRVALRKKF